MSKALRPYIGVGDYVKTEYTRGHHAGEIEEGTVIADSEGTLRVATEDGANVNAEWVNILSWRENAS
jgi:hypothetical protein